MLNNTVLDVAIGLIFIYLLYSLLATTVKEFVATIFAYRARMLERGIEQMLDGKNLSYYWWDKVWNFFLWLFMVKMAKPKKPTKANKNESGDNKKNLEQGSELTDFMTKRAISPSVSKAIKVRRIALDAKAELFAANITTHALYKRSSDNSVFFKKPSLNKPAYLAADTFSDILIDILSANKSGNGKPFLLKDIANFVNTGINNNPELQRILNIYIEQANGDLQKFKLLIENWYNDTMDRVTGWYKKQANRILITIGLVLAIVFNVNTIEIVGKLSQDKTVREAVVKNAIQYVNNHIDSPHVTQPKNTTSADTGATKQSLPKNAPKDTAGIATKDTASKQATVNKDLTITKNNTSSPDTNFNDIRLKLDSMKALYKSSIEENNEILALGWGDYGYSKTAKYAAWVKAGKLPKDKPEEPGFFCKILYVICQLSWKRALGFLITAFAISLGAPFWFDLLNKFVNLRVSGTKPDEKSSTPVSKTASLNQKPDPAAKA